MPEKSLTASVLWDRFGIGVSGICAIHCLIFPALISILPLWSFIPALHDWVHPVFIVLIIPIIYFASRRSHYDVKITSLLIVGFILILTGWLVGHYLLGILFETITTILGSFLLIAGHWLNYRHHQQCTNHNHRHHPIKESLEETK